MKLAVIGDVHHAWTEVDTAFFNASDYDALLFVGDIYNFSLQRGLRAASELARLDNKSIHAPWEVPPLDLEAAGITLGRDYPEPIVDHTEAREDFLALYKALADG